MNTETATVVVPHDRLIEAFRTLTQTKDRVEFEPVEVPVKIRVSKSNPDYNILDFRTEQLAGQRLKHSRRRTTDSGKTIYEGCQCGCQPVQPRWKSVSQSLTLYVPVRIPLSEEPFRVYQSLSELEYRPFSTPLPDAGYLLDAEMVGAIISAKVSNDPWYLSKFFLARRQREKAHLKERLRKYEAGEFSNPLSDLAELEEEKAA